MRKALFVGIDYYDHGTSLFGCVNDAKSVKSILERHEDGSINFDCKLLIGTSSEERVNRGALKDHIEDLFNDPAPPEIALFYFAGHGHLEATGGYLIATDSRRGDEGVSLSEILTLANKSKATNKIIILDSCHSGIFGTAPSGENLTVLSNGLTVLTASTKDQYATERNGRGSFTNLLVDALNGSAANLIGDITPGSIYAHIDQSLGSWEKQRPVFKTNVREFVSLRKTSPSISLADLQHIMEFFPSSGYEFALDPTFEPEMNGRTPGMPPPIPGNTKFFALLQKCNRLNLLVPVGAPHMWHAAMESKSCRLTELGEHYRRLVEKNRI